MPHLKTSSIDFSLPAGQLGVPMKRLEHFIIDASVDPPLTARAEAAAKTIDASAFGSFDPKRSTCTNAQRETMRTFLLLTGLEFDDEGWDELLDRPDMQQLLMGALSEGVIKAKQPAVTVAFMRIRAGIENALKTPTFPDPGPTGPTPSTLKKVAPHLPRPIEKTPARLHEPVNESDVLSFLEGKTVDWSGVNPQDLSAAKECLKRKLIGLGKRSFAWYAGGINMKFVPRMKDYLYAGETEGEDGERKPTNGKHVLCYAIEERNGSVTRLDGIFRKGDAWYVAPLPTEEMDAAQLIDE